MPVKRKTVLLTVDGNALTAADAATGQATADAGVQGENEAVWLHADVPADWQDLTVRLRVTALDGTFDESAAAAGGAVDMPLRQGVLVPGRLAVALVGLSPDGDSWLVRKSADCRTLTVQASTQPADPAAELYPQAFESLKDEVQGECIHAVVGRGAAQVERLDGQTVAVGFTGGGGGDMLAANYANGSGGANGNRVDHALAADSAAAGSALESALRTGWAPLPACVYASAATFTVTQDMSAILAVGDKIRLAQSGAAKYFYVTGVSAASGITTVTVTGGSDYALANAAVVSPAFSKAASPAGFPDWLNWSPAWLMDTGAAFSPSAVTARFRLSGSFLQIAVNATGSVSGAGSIWVRAGLPVRGKSLYNPISGLWIQGGVPHPAIAWNTGYDQIQISKTDISVLGAGTYQFIVNGGLAV